MVVCADTSFLFALYGNDAHTPKALAWSRSNPDAISICEFTEFELGNALRFSEFRKILPVGRAATFFSHYEADREAGRIALELCNLAQIVAEAKKLSVAHTVKEGHRAFDILHVAAAVVLGASAFLSFDANQKKLARAAGLVLPV